MPCRANCDLRALLLAKEEKISRLQQVKRWVDSLYQQEPHRREETLAKKNIVSNQTIQALAEVGLLVHRLANGCELCNAY